ncbi:MAG TPA: glycosyltransferase [Thermodesulfovibrionales bacterium]|nr:glycosyltransferase [Thermodesulfovibrionales bacterium]
MHITKAKPDVSVVMSVYNDADHLRESIDSILSQEGVDFEFIVVNDGSTDGSKEILDEYTLKDKRIRVIHQGNHGLTRALIRGCTEAKGEYIARHDAGDISFPSRLGKQLSCLKSHPDATLVSCGTRFVGPGGEHLYDILQDSEEATSSLKNLTMKAIRGPSHHGSTFFPRRLYEKVGGYRAAFYFGQDLDLWIRLAEHGTHYVIPELLYQASITAESISSLYRKEQVQLTKLMLEAAAARRRNMSELHILEKAHSIQPNLKRMRSPLAQAKGFYFIGACLRRRGSPKAGFYFKAAIKACPIHLRSWYRLVF